jgi:hypothetical protein
MFTQKRVDAVTQAVEAVTNAAQNAEIEAKRNQPEPSATAVVSRCRLPLGISRAAYSPLRGMPELPRSVSRVA